jgi:hypothetical protein
MKQILISSFKKVFKLVFTVVNHSGVVLNNVRI